MWDSTTLPTNARNWLELNGATQQPKGTPDSDTKKKDKWA